MHELEITFLDNSKEKLHCDSWLFQTWGCFYYTYGKIGYFVTNVKKVRSL